MINEKEILRISLYRIFHIPEDNEDYATTVKLLYIYSYVSTHTDLDPLEIIELLRKQLKYKANAEYVNGMYRSMKVGGMVHSGRFLLSHSTPQSNTNYYLGHRLA